MEFTASQGSEDDSPTEYCFMGLKDGSVIVFSLPIPTMIIQESIETSTMSEVITLQLDGDNANPTLTLLEDPEAIINDDIRDNNNTISNRPRSSSAAFSNSVPATTTSSKELIVFDVKKCRKFALHAGE